MNQNIAKEAINKTATGTTIAGIKVLRLLDEEELLAAFEVAAAVSDECVELSVVWVFEDSDARIDERSAEFVMRTVFVLVVSENVTVSMYVERTALVSLANPVIEPVAPPVKGAPIDAGNVPGMF